MSFDDDRDPDAFDPEIDEVELPRDGTMQDLFDALRAFGVDEYDFLREVEEAFPSEAEFVTRLRNDASAATKKLIADVFPDDELDEVLPHRFVDRAVFEAILRHAPRPPEPMRPVEDIDRERATDRLKQIFADVDPGGDLPPNDLWMQAMTEAKSPVPLIVAARRLGAPDAYIRRFALAHCLSFVSGKVSRDGQLQNFGVLARFLTNMKFGTPEDVVFFVSLASGNGGR